MFNDYILHCARLCCAVTDRRFVVYEGVLLVWSIAVVCCEWFVVHLRPVGMKHIYVIMQLSTVGSYMGGSYQLVGETSQLLRC